MRSGSCSTLSAASTTRFRPRYATRYGLCGLREAFIAIHRPADYAEAARARKRLKWDEAFLLQVALAQRRIAAEALPAAPRRGRDGGLLAEFDPALPFTLTDGQRDGRQDHRRRPGPRPSDAPAAAG